MEPKYKYLDRVFINTKFLDNFNGLLEAKVTGWETKDASKTWTYFLDVVNYHCEGNYYYGCYFVASMDNPLLVGIMITGNKAVCSESYLMPYSKSLKILHGCK